MDPASSHPQPEPDAFPALTDALRRLDRPPHSVSPSVNEAIRSAARAHLADRRRARHARWVMAGGLGGVAAAVIMGMLLQTQHSPSQPMQTVVGDIDANGRVNIIDAYLLARTLEQGGDAAAAASDLSGDGLVDGDDVKAIATLAVSISAQPAGGQG